MKKVRFDYRTHLRTSEKCEWITFMILIGKLGVFAPPKKKVDDIFNQPIYFFTICNAESDSLWVVLQGRNLMFTGLNLQLLTELQYELLLQRAVGHRQHLLQQLDQPHVLHKTRELA